MATVSRILLVCALLAPLLAAPCFAAACEDACNADYNSSVASAQAVLDSKSYYCGYTETNCWSREGLPSGAPDPCWSMCGQSNFNDNSFQSCCFESSRMNAERSLAQCLADCAPANPAQPPVQPQQNKSNANVTYNVEITSSGSVSITDLSGNLVSKLANYPVSTKTGSDGNLYVVFRTPGGDKEVRLHLAPDTDFRFDPGGQCNAPSSAMFSAQPGASLELPQNSPFEQNTQCRSSEHGSIRGTINGGGDFIKGRSIASLAGTARLDIAPPPVSSGRIDVNESTGPDGPGFELTASLPGGNIIVNSTGGDATYSAEPSQGGVIISVSSGSVSITSSRLPGASTTLSAGESAFVDPLDINVSTQVLPVPTPSAACTASSDCPASELCMNGKCETPQCFSAFALAALLGAAFVSTRGKEE